MGDIERMMIFCAECSDLFLESFFGKSRDRKSKHISVFQDDGCQREDGLRDGTLGHKIHALPALCFQLLRRGNPHPGSIRVFRSFPGIDKSKLRIIFQIFIEMSANRPKADQANFLHDTFPLTARTLPGSTAGSCPVSL